MSRKKQDNEKKRPAGGEASLTTQKNAAEIELSPITDTLKDNYMPYAMSVIISRAIPEIDGFKPSQRKLLYTMYRMGLMKGPRSKSADIVGQTMALNPHGDVPIYETMVRMTRGNGALLNPWVDSKGNFGKVYSRDMQYAAYRYTEARLDPSCECLFSGLEKNAVDFVDNYSGTTQEPVLLPAVIPTVLINANQGIAVGMASNIASFNLRECCMATAALIDDPQADILTLMPAPDFSTGCSILYNKEQMREIYESGRGSFRMRAKATLSPKENRIEVTEIPYNTTVEGIIDDITKQAKAGKIREINDIRDETDLNGLRITIDCKKNVDLDLLLQKLYRFSGMESSFPCNFNILIKNSPRVMGVREILNEWIEWRRVCLSRELTFNRDKLEQRLHLLKALENILLDIDRAIRIIRRTEREEEVVPHLMAAFSLDQIQAEFVAEIKLRHLNREYLLRRTEEIHELEDQIRDLERTLQSRALLNKAIKVQLKNYADQYGRERKTLLSSEQAVDTSTFDEVIEDYNLKIFFTREGYIKKMPLTSLRSAGDLKLKENDQIIQEMEGSNRGEILFFSTKGNVYKLKIFELPDHKPSDFGEYTPNILELEEDERILFIHICDEAFSGVLLLAFANGRAVKVEVSSYETKNRRRKLLNGIYGGSELRGLLWAKDENAFGDILLSSTQERMVLLDSSLIPLKKTKNSQGVQVMTLRKGYELRKLISVKEDEKESYSYYRIRSLPAAGRFIRNDFPESQQLSFDEA